MEKSRAYIAVVGHRFHPTLSDDAATLLEKHFERCHLSESATIPVNVRFLESIIRLSQAHARLMYRNEVTQYSIEIRLNRMCLWWRHRFSGFHQIHCVSRFPEPRPKLLMRPSNQSLL
jgi:DNA replicative helicase MCM subunit Mcm2 (Cdc46/Mcm family)